MTPWQWLANLIRANTYTSEPTYEQTYTQPLDMNMDIYTDSRPYIALGGQTVTTQKPSSSKPFVSPKVVAQRPTGRVTLNGRVYPSPQLQTFIVPGTQRKLTVDRQVGPILVAFAADYHRRIRAIDTGNIDDGGYADRPARGAPHSLSNHANGSAIDLNYSREGGQGSAAGKAFYADPAHRAAIDQLLREYSPVIAWGGRWNARDYMHFEIAPNTSAKELQAVINRLQIDSQGRRHA